jgi:hypothetical protein
MNYRFESVLLAFGLLPTALLADCTDVIRLSKTTSQVVQDRTIFESNASAFCKEYYSSSTSSRSASYRASYKFLAASMGNANANETEVASKVCSADTKEYRRADAYRQYVETISDKAFAAYEACKRFESADLTFNLNTMLRRELWVSVGNSSNRLGEASISFDASEGVKCDWNRQSEQGRISLKNGTSALLKCSRANIGSEGAITISEASSGAGNTFVIPWPEMDDKGVPRNLAQQLARQMEEATTQLKAANELLAQAVVSFRAEECPSGWEEYIPARGRFVRGLDKGGKIDPDGKRQFDVVQEDEFREHAHTYHEFRHQVGTGAGPFRDGLTANAGNRPAIKTTPEGGKETRPKNVALLYCIRK